MFAHRQANALSPSKYNQPYDYVIVGAGSAGCVLAHRLSANPDCQVLLLEAGGRNRSLFVDMPSAFSIPMNRRRFNWGYASEPEPELLDRSLHCPRGRGLGGSSAINGMVYVRGNPKDFDEWHQLGATGWGYEAVLPYFKRAQTHRGTLTRFRGDSGPLITTDGALKNPLYEAFLMSAQQAGYRRSDDLNGAEQEAFGPLTMTVDNGIRCSTARAYLNPIRHRPNLTIATGALCDRIAFRPQLSVQWSSGRARHSTPVHGEVILSTGPIGSPAILQRSGVGDPEHLKSVGIPVEVDAPEVGANLKDHLEVYLQHRCSQPISLNGVLNPLGKLRIGVEYLLTRTGLGATNHFEAGGFIRSSAASWADIQFHFLPAALSYDGTRVVRGHGFQVHVGPMKPVSHGTVKIKNADPLTPPTLRFNYMQDASDRRVFRECIQLSREILSQPALAEFDAGELAPGPELTSDKALDTWIAANAESAYHPCGTCRMGSDARAVVDPEGRVQGLERVRVADSSVFPNITNGNLNAPTIMTAEKIAAHITGELLDPMA